jgi:membrane protein implicated in regulation of membrane protease activity
MPWWGWIILGALLLGAELLGVDAAFYLVFIGLAAVITGFIEIAGLNLEPWLQWVVFAVIALVLMVLFRKKVYASLRGGGVGYEVGPAGETIRLEHPLAPGEKGRISYRGTDWTIVNAGDQPFEKGQQVKITAVEGLTLKLGGAKE